MASIPSFKTGDMALGVIKPHPGQEEDYCGVAACTAFRDMLINALNPIRYSKVGFEGVITAGVSLAFTSGANNLTAFANVIGDNAAANTNFTAPLTLADTNYHQSEDPVPQNGGFLFCAVGMNVALERPFVQVDATGARSYPAYVSQVADYRNTIQEALYCGASATIQYGNNGCQYEIGLLKHFPSPNTPHGGDTMAPGVIAGTLMFNPLNAVVCIDSLKNNRRAVIAVALAQDFTVDQTAQVIPAPAAASHLIVPAELSLFGFVIQVPTAGDFFTVTGGMGLSQTGPNANFQAPQAPQAPQAMAVGSLAKAAPAQGWYR